MREPIKGDESNLFTLLAASLDKPRFNIPETAIFENGLLQGWLFTSKEGIVLRKRDQNCTLDLFAKRLSKLASDDPDRLMAVVRRADGCNTLRASPFFDLCSDLKRSEIQRGQRRPTMTFSIQAYIPAFNDARYVTTFEQDGGTYYIHSVATRFSRWYKNDGFNSARSSSHQSDSFIVDESLSHGLRDATIYLVKYLQDVSDMTVSRIVCEFIQDTSRRLFLLSLPSYEFVETGRIQNQRQQVELMHGGSENEADDEEEEQEADEEESQQNEDSEDAEEERKDAELESITASMNDLMALRDAVSSSKRNRPPPVNSSASLSSLSIPNLNLSALDQSSSSSSRPGTSRGAAPSSARPVSARSAVSSSTSRYQPPPPFPYPDHSSFSNRDSARSKSSGSPIKPQPPSAGRPPSSGRASSRGANTGASSSSARSGSLPPRSRSNSRARNSNSNNNSNNNTSPRRGQLPTARTGRPTSRADGQKGWSDSPYNQPVVVRPRTRSGSSASSSHHHNQSSHGHSQNRNSSSSSIPFGGVSIPPIPSSRNSSSRNNYLNLYEHDDRSYIVSTSPQSHSALGVLSDNDDDDDDDDDFVSAELEQQLMIMSQQGYASRASANYSYGNDGKLRPISANVLAKGSSRSNNLAGGAGSGGGVAGNGSAKKARPVSSSAYLAGYNSRSNSFKEENKSPAAVAATSVIAEAPQPDVSVVSSSSSSSDSIPAPVPASVSSTPSSESLAFAHFQKQRRPVPLLSHVQQLENELVRSVSRQSGASSSLSLSHSRPHSSAAGTFITSNDKDNSEGGVDIQFEIGSIAISSSSSSASSSLPNSRPGSARPTSARRIRPVSSLASASQEFIASPKPENNSSQPIVSVASGLSSELVSSSSSSSLTPRPPISSRPMSAVSRPTPSAPFQASVSPRKSQSKSPTRSSNMLPLPGQSQRPQSARPIHSASQRSQLLFTAPADSPSISPLRSPTRASAAAAKPIAAQQQQQQQYDKMEAWRAKVAAEIAANSSSIVMVEPEEQLGSESDGQNHLAPPTPTSWPQSPAAGSSSFAKPQIDISNTIIAMTVSSPPMSPSASASSSGGQGANSPRRVALIDPSSSLTQELFSDVLRETMLSIQKDLLKAGKGTQERDLLLERKKEVEAKLLEQEQALNAKAKELQDAVKRNQQLRTQVAAAEKRLQMREKELANHETREKKLTKELAEEQARNQKLMEQKQKPASSGSSTPRRPLSTASRPQLAAASPRSVPTPVTKKPAAATTPRSALSKPPANAPKPAVEVQAKQAAAAQEEQSPETAVSPSLSVPDESVSAVSSPPVDSKVIEDSNSPINSPRAHLSAPSSPTRASSSSSSSAVVEEEEQLPAQRVSSPRSVAFEDELEEFVQEGEYDLEGDDDWSAMQVQLSMSNRRKSSNSIPSSPSSSSVASSFSSSNPMQVKQQRYRDVLSMKKELLRAEKRLSEKGLGAFRPTSPARIGM